MFETGPEGNTPPADQAPGSDTAGDYVEQLDDVASQPIEDVEGLTETYIPQSVIITWLAQQHLEINTQLINLRKERPSLFTEPIKRIQYAGRVGILAGERQMLNRIARRLIEESEQ